MSDAATIRNDEPPTHRWQRPDVPAPLIVWEYAFSLERIIEEQDREIARLQAVVEEANRAD